MTATDSAPDAAAAEAFLGKVLVDTSGFGVTVLASLGDRLGLWKQLAAGGPARSDELAVRAGIDERYAREWLHAMTTAGYLDHDTATDRFTLPAAHTPVLAEEGGHAFFGGVHQMLHGMVTVYDQLLEVFKSGGGVPQGAYHPDMWDGMDRFTAGWFDNLLVQEWLPAMPDVDAKLRAGADVADVGCGRGRGLVRLAEQYPASRFVGYDVFPPTIAAARANAEAAGVGDRVRFEHRDAAAGLPEPYDLVFTFDVVHDAVDPRGLLAAIRAALRPDGIYVCLDINNSPDLAGNVGPLGAFFHSAIR